MSDQLQEMSEARGVDEGTHAQRFDALFSSLRDIQRGVQVVRDKQVPYHSYMSTCRALNGFCNSLNEMKLQIHAAGTTAKAVAHS